MMKTIIAGIVAFFFAGAALAQSNTPNGSQANVPVPSGSGGAGSFVCTGTIPAQVCAIGPAAQYLFKGSDNSTQFAVGYTASAVNFLEAVGAASGFGPTMLCLGADANVSCNITAKGAANINLSNGSGIFASFADPGAAITGQFTFTPGIGSSPANISAPNGVNIVGSPVTTQASLPLLFPRYVAGQWKIPFGVPVSSTGAASTNGSIRLFFGYIWQTLTINSLGVRCSTGSAGGNIQLAIYSNNSATNLPTGSPLVSTSSISVTSTGSLNATVSIQLTPGWYWFASNSDNAVAVFTSVGSTDAMAASLTGSSAQATSIQNAIGVVGTTVTQTFGTWPSLTAASFVDVAGNPGMPLVQFLVASVP